MVTDVYERCVVGVGAVAPEDVVRVAREGTLVELSAEACQAISKSRAVVAEMAASDTPGYGVSTGFGALATRHIEPGLRTQLQKSLIRSPCLTSGSTP